MTTLPAERDLPPAARAAARTRVVAAVQPPGRPPVRPPRRWLPLAAAAALVVVLAGAGIAASRLGGAGTSTATRPAQPTPAAGPTVPAAFARQCDKAVLAGPGHPVAVFRDGNGLLAWLDYGAFSALCSYDGPGRLIEATTARRLSAYPGYLPGSGPPASVEQVVAQPPSVWVLGAARRGVTMLRVTWPGAAPATVTVSGPFWVARATLPPAQPADVEPVIVAYDEDGQVVR